MMAREFWLWLLLGNAAFVVIYGASVPVTCTDEQDGTSYAPGDQWSPDPCTQCECSDDGQSQCFSQACLPPRCVDSSSGDGQCCPTCPNGENCKAGDTIIPNDGATHFLDTMEECRCEETDYGQLEAVCSLPPPPPPPPSCEGNDGTIYQPGDQWSPDPCTQCECSDDGQSQCFSQACLPPRCVDSSNANGQCCPSCPNGENCEAKGTIIPNDGATHYLDTMEECRCEETDYGQLEAVCSLPPPPPPTTPPPSCEGDDGTIYENGATWKPDACTWCSCHDGEAECIAAAYQEPRCVDSVQEPGECFPTCPNGENCESGGTIIPNGETRTLEDGQECWCEEGNYGGLETVCSPPPPPSSCDVDGVVYENGENWQPDPCTWCSCDQGQHWCAVAGCASPRCVDEVHEADQCCPSCPNGENCAAGNTIIPYGERTTLEDGQECWCDEESYDTLEAVCTPPPTTTPPTPPMPPTVPSSCEVDGVVYENGDTWQPDPCTWCSCEQSQPMCAMASCAIPRCVDEVHEADQCCPSCPNGENCETGGTIIPYGETRTLEDGQNCFCEEGNYGELEAVCSPPPPTFPPMPTTPPSGCEVDGVVHEEGDFWQQDACTWGSCIDGEVMYAVQDCPAPECDEQVFDPLECCGHCPEETNCQIGDISIPKDETVTLDNGEMCTCVDSSGDGQLEALCVPPTTTSAMNCPAENWQPDPCTWCTCDQGEPVCAMASCAPPRCVDEVNEADQCCPSCPNGPNCQYNGIIISEGETVTLEDGQVCSCQGEEWGPLEAVCESPPPPPPPTTPPPPPPPTTTTTLSPREARQQAKKEERQAKREARRDRKAARQNKRAARQAKRDTRSLEE